MIDEKASSLITGMEDVLAVWMEDQTSRILIQSEALTLSSSVKAERQGRCRREAGSRPRLGRARFKERSCPCSIEVRGDATGADGEAAASHLGLPGALVRVATLTSRFFRVDKTALDWRTMPSRTFIAGEERSFPGFRASNARVSRG